MAAGRLEAGLEGGLTGFMSEPGSGLSQMVSGLGRIADIMQGWKRPPGAESINRGKGKKRNEEEVGKENMKRRRKNEEGAGEREGEEGWGGGVQGG